MNEAERKWQVYVAQLEADGRAADRITSANKLLKRMKNKYNVESRVIDHIADGSKLVAAETPEEAAEKYLRGVPLSERSIVYEETLHLERLAYFAALKWAKNNPASLANWERKK